MTVKRKEGTGKGRNEGRMEGEGVERKGLDIGSEIVEADIGKG